MRSAAVLGALVVLGCGGAPARARPTFSIAAGLRPQALTVPADAGVDFAACTGAYVYVPLRGGVLIAGWNGWLVEPGQPQILGVACDEAGHVFMVSERAVSVVEAGVAKEVATLPAGAWRVVSSPNSRVWVWGVGNDDGRWKIFQVRPDGLVTISDDVQTIRAVAVVGNAGLLTAIGDALVAWSATGEAKPLARLGADIDGLAVAPGGRTYVSTSEGIGALDTLDGPLVPIATGLHGPLRARFDVLYVRSLEQGAVVRIAADVARMSR